MPALTSLSKHDMADLLVGKVRQEAERCEELLQLLREARREIQLVHTKDKLVYDPTLIARIDAVLQKAKTTQHA